MLVQKIANLFYIGMVTLDLRIILKVKHGYALLH